MAKVIIGTYRKVGLDASAVVAGSVATALSQLAIVWLFARMAGAEGVGSYVFALAVATPLFLALQLGMRNVYLAAHGGPPLLDYLALRTNLCVLGVLLLLMLGAWVPSGPRLDVVVPVAAIKFADSLLDMLFAKLQEDDEVGLMGSVNVAKACAALVLVGLLCELTGNIATALWGSFVASALALASVVAYLRRSTRLHRGPELPEQGGKLRILKKALPLGVSNSLSALQTHLPVLFLGAYGAVEDAGLYAAAVSFVTLANLVCAACQMAVLPRMVRMRAVTGDAGLARAAGRLGWLSLGCGAAAGLLVVAVGQGAITAFYGREFVVGRPLIVLVGLAVAIAPVFYVFSVVVLAQGRYRRTLAASVLATLTTAGVGTVLALAGRFDLVGAACMMLAGAVAALLATKLVSVRH
ncbi:lipopolysaccharide biosynthesis protein [Ramlibacter rhizophilus]|uniref:Lipopolysaccharide biosynthesis protein n=1 Tax=Ramlibacter rhizophilus TaxID=1781167 RepID=A0A4Z0BEZ9_9BURK|nr:lipopolysaccharide biosynthesis protein [Ramlibacter rhizophilus]TFY96887.1 lipopolysaccharide biosynthesis protein [Ramlibacter rhizophilus]